LDWDEPSAEAPSSPILQQGGSSFSDLLSIGNSDAQAISQPSTRAAPASNNIDDIMNLFNSPAPQQPQQQQSQMMNDFTSDLFGSSSPPPQQQPASSSTTKDPFADLF
jgi:hypothetical protein